MTNLFIASVVRACDPNARTAGCGIEKSNNKEQNNEKGT